MPTNRQLAKGDQGKARERQLPSVRSPFSRFFDESFWDPFRLFDTSLMPSIVGEGLQRFTPLVDVSETDKEITIEADLPGYDPKNVKVDVSNNMLTISGMTEEKTAGDKRWHRRERSYSYAEFTRQILLPDYADGARAECTLRNGILTIAIPKKPEAEPKHLQVKVKS